MVIFAATTGTLFLFSLLLVVIGLIIIAFFWSFISLWIQCVMAGAEIGLWDLLGMFFRKVNMNTIVRAKIMAVQSGVTENYAITTRDLEAHYLANGNVPNTIRALIAAHSAHIDLDWRTARAIDLAGRDILDAVRASVYPKVIDCPDTRRGQMTLDAVAADGIQLKVRARVTVRTNLASLVGGATEETVIARVGQGIVQAIGSTPSYKDVLENPERISQTVLNQGLEEQTMFNIVSIDIADIDVGENIGARLMADQAEADMRVAQAKAEQRRAEFAAREQEMVALVQANRAQVVLSEAEVPKAIAGSLREGKMGLLDYFELKNVQADTQMRSALAGAGLGKSPSAN